MNQQSEHSGFTGPGYVADRAIRLRPSFAERGAEPRGNRSVRYAARSQIFAEGDPTGHVYEITEGSVILVKSLPDGRRQIIEVLSVGDVFGLAAGASMDVGAEALSAVRVAMFERSALDRDPELRDRLFVKLREQLCTLHDHALLLGRKSAQERVATFIMRLLPRRDVLSCPGPRPSQAPTRVALAMTRQEIADYLGLTIETVSRAFSALRRAGVIAYRKHDDVTIPSMCRLCLLTGAH